MFTSSRFLRCAPQLLLLCLWLLSSRPASAQITELLMNGGFESGDFTGWTRADNPNNPARGSYFVDNNADDAPDDPLKNQLAPVTSLTTLGAKSGSFYAVSDMDEAGTYALLQSFTAPTLSPGQSLIFSYDMYVYDWQGEGGAIHASGLDHTSGGTGAPNQHARVDLLGQNASAFATDSQSVVRNFYQGVDNAAGSGASPSYIRYTHDITNLVTAGQTYQVRFATVANQEPVNQSVDNVSVSVVPEPGTGLMLFSLGVPLLAMRPRRRQRRRRRRFTLNQEKEQDNG